MGEATGNIAFLNVHDYISDFDGRKWRGCLALLKGEDSKDVSLYTESDLLVAGLVMVPLESKSDSIIWTIMAISHAKRLHDAA